MAYGTTCKSPWPYAKAAKVLAVAKRRCPWQGEVLAKELHPPEVCGYKDLLPHAQKAVDQRLNDWEYAGAVTNSDKTRAAVKRTVFIGGQLPTSVAAREITRSNPIDSDTEKEYKDFDAYHKDYISHVIVPEHPPGNRWPSIIGCSGPPITGSAWEEFIEDGWHRFHSYVRDGAKKVPVILPLWSRRQA